MNESLGILVVEDTPADAGSIRDLLPATGAANFQVESVARLSAARNRLQGTGIDLVLLDLGLPDSQGLPTLRQLRAAAPEVPVIVLTGNDDRKLGLAALQEGAQEFLVKGQVNQDLLERSIRYSLERHKSAAAMRENEARYRLRFNSSKDAVFVNIGMSESLRPGKFIAVNDLACEQLGYTREELLQKTVAEINGPEGLAAIPAAVARLATDGHALWEGMHVAKGGRKIPVEINAHQFLLDGKVTVFSSVRDITERKQAEVSLHLTEFAVENTGDAVAWFQPDGSLVRVNEATCRLSGYARAELLTKKIQDLDPSSSPAVWAERWAELRQKKVLVFENHCRTKDGRMIPVEVLANHTEFGGREFNCSFVRDISARKQAEAALRASEARFRSLFEDAVVGFYRTTPDGRILMVNPALLELLGFSSLEELAQRNLEQEGYAPSYSRAAFKEDLERDGLVLGKEAVWQRRDGSLRVVRENCRVVRDESGRAIYYEGSIEDITERKRTEEQMLVQFSALTAAANAIVITDRKGKIEWVNPSFTRLTGYTSEEAIGQNPRLLKSGEHPPDFYAALWATITAGNVWHGEMINRHKVGRLYTEDVTITPVRGASGEIAHFVAIKQDVTERRALENQLRQAQKMEAMGTLVGGIAHDFNNILAAMVGYGYLLQQDTADNPEVQENIAEILQAANRAKDLVRQILTFSRQREQKPEVIKLDLVVKEALKFLRASLPAHIKIEMRLAAEAPAVLADPTQVYQVAMNLATNALHAMEDRPGRLTVNLDPVLPDAELRRTHPELKPVPYARLTVADTGHGMDAQIMERIFDPFFTTKPVGKGTGLGLSVVHGIIKSHGGVITVESQVGVGTTFHVYFPAQTQDLTSTETVTLQVSRGRGQKILFLDDEPALTAVSQKQLRRLNYQVTISNSAPEALRWFRENPAQFDLVITDLTMPDLNGVEVARQIHSVRPELPIILASGYSASVNAETRREAGIQELIEKPVSWTALAEVVHRLLKQADRL